MSEYRDNERFVALVGYFGFLSYDFFDVFRYNFLDVVWVFRLECFFYYIVICIYFMVFKIKKWFRMYKDRGKVY